jgi:hypothetical protein
MLRQFLTLASIVALFVCSAYATAPAEELPKTSVATPEERAKWPKTLDEAVERLIAELPAKNIGEIRAMKKKELIRLHMGLGLYIRNFFGLRRGNRALMEATNPHDPDDASMIIIEALWRRLRATPNI